MKITSTCFVAVCVIISIVSFSNADSQSSIIAVIGNEKCLSTQLAVDQNVIKKTLEKRLGRKPQTKEIAAAVGVAKTKLLVDWAYRTVLKNGASEYGILITEKDQQRKLASIYKDDDQVLNRILNITQQLPEAWRDARAHPEQERHIYEKSLKDLMSYDRWKRYLADDDTTETIRRFEQMSPPKKSDLYRPSESLRKMLTECALRKQVTENITATDEELQAEYKGMGYEKSFDEMRHVVEKIALGAKREHAWREWLRKRMTDGAIVIYDDKLLNSYNAYLKQSLGISEKSGSGINNKL